MHLFISHATKDAGREALALAQALEALGHRCWIAPRDVRPGIPYPRQIVSAVQEAQGLVLLLSRAASESADVLQEVQMAAANKKTVAPVVMAGADPGADLSYYVSVRHQIAWDSAGAVAQELTRTFLAPTGQPVSQGAPQGPSKPPLDGVRYKDSLAHRAKNRLAIGPQGWGRVVMLLATIAAIIVASIFSLQNWVYSRSLANPANWSTFELDGGLSGRLEAERAITRDTRSTDDFFEGLDMQNRAMCQDGRLLPAAIELHPLVRQIDDSRRQYDAACENAGRWARCTKIAHIAHEVRVSSDDLRAGICRNYRNSTGAIAD